MSRYIPPLSQKIASRKSSAVVYISGVPDRLIAIGYYGKSEKPAFHFRFRSAEARAEHVKKWFERMAAAAAAKVERKEQRKADLAKPHKLVVGSILKASWGYEQTNVDYYEVVALVGKRSVDIRPIGSGNVASPDEEMHGDRGYCVPVPGNFTGEKIRKQVSVSGDSVRMTSYSSASLVLPIEGLGGIVVYPRAYWSSYA